MWGRCTEGKSGWMKMMMLKFQHDTVKDTMECAGIAHVAIMPGSVGVIYTDTSNTSTYSLLYINKLGI
jgi:hypothetical protein